MLVKYFPKRWTCTGTGFTEYKKTVRVYMLRRVFSFSWVWAVDMYEKVGYTPYNSRMNTTAFLGRVGYLELLISERRR